MQGPVSNDCRIPGLRVDLEMTDLTASGVPRKGSSTHGHQVPCSAPDKPSGSFITSCRP